LYFCRNCVIIISVEYWRTLMAKLIIEYNKDFGDVVPDGQVQSYTSYHIRLAIEDGEKIIVGSVILIDSFRLAVKQGEISNEDVEIWFNDGTTSYTITLDKDGRCNVYPFGFCDAYDNILRKLL